MRLNHITLAFTGPFEELEKPFIEAYFKKYLSQSKILHLITIFFYGISSVVDFVLFPDIKLNLFIIRLITCTIFLLGFFCSYTHFFARIWQLLYSFYVVLTGFSFLAIMIMTPPPLNFSYAAGVMICIIFGYIFIRARFIISVFSCWLLFICYEMVVIFIIDTPMSILITTSYYLGIVTVLGMLIAHTLEYNERKEFYQSYILEKTNRDLTEQIMARQRAEDKLTSALKKKEIYLKEIHHRVKNNLQVISSLLDMTCNRSENHFIQKTLMGARAKIQAMSLVHHQLYKNEDVHKIDMSIHINELYHNLSMVYGSGCQISAEINVQDVFLPLDRAMPCALVMNELISNALEHAFVGRSRGILNIRMNQEDGRISLYIHDNGIGLPLNLDMEKIDSLGLRLVQILVTKQLEGNLQMVRNGGTTFTIWFENQKKQPDD